MINNGTTGHLVQVQGIRTRPGSGSGAAPAADNESLLSGRGGDHYLDY